MSTNHMNLCWSMNWYGLRLLKMEEDMFRRGIFEEKARTKWLTCRETQEQTTGLPWNCEEAEKILVSIDWHPGPIDWLCWFCEKLWQKQMLIDWLLTTIDWLPRILLKIKCLMILIYHGRLIFYTMICIYWFNINWSNSMRMNVF